MKLFSFVSFTLLLPIGIFSNDRLYMQLEKLYQKNPKQCLQVCKKKIAQRPERAVPYYFVTVIYYNQYNACQTLKSKYMNLGRSVNYANKFEKKKYTELEDRIDWGTFKKEIEIETVAFIEKLESNKEREWSDKLYKKLIKLNTAIPKPKRATISSPNKGNKNDLASSNSKADNSTPTKYAFSKNGIVPIKTIPNPVSESIDGHYFGMPSGKERVASSDHKKEKELLAIINTERSKKGLSRLIWNEDLANASRYHAYDLATQQYFEHSSHDRKNGKLEIIGNTFDRIEKFYNDSFVNSENIAAGSSTPKGTYSQWYNSEGHHRNMFRGSSNKVGIGFYSDPTSPYRHYWVFCTAR